MTESWKPKSEYPDMKGYYHLQRNFFKKYTTEEVINMAILYLRLGLNASSINIFYKIVRLSIENNINLFILFAPYRSDLIALLPSDIVIFYKLFKIMSYFKENYNSIFFHSFIRDSRFKDEFFGDSFHLTPGGPGSTMMTEMIASLLRGISCQ
ncbi:hypothetical protein FACS1894205_1200 [Alphaproteobacteria bacterium]|nr:hypothetical protein FACS1894205_1200 [Alphaproteobacteria bacterium]